MSRSPHGLFIENILSVITVFLLGATFFFSLSPEYFYNHTNTLKCREGERGTVNDMQVSLHPFTSALILPIVILFKFHI